MFPLYVIAGFIFVGVVIIFAIYYSKSMKMTSFTEGQVVSSEDKVIRDERERREETHLVCSYSVRGVDYQIPHVIRGHLARLYPPGRSIIVWYNPTSPEMAKIKGRGDS